MRSQTLYSYNYWLKLNTYVHRLTATFLPILRSTALPGCPIKGVSRGMIMRMFSISGNMLVAAVTVSLVYVRVPEVGVLNSFLRVHLIYFYVVLYEIFFFGFLVFQRWNYI